MSEAAAPDTTPQPARVEPAAIDLARSLPLGDLLSLGAQMRDDLTPAALMQEVADAIHTVLGYQQVYVRLRNPDTDELEALAFSGLPEPVIGWLRANPAAPTFYQSLLQQSYRIGDLSRLPAGQAAERAPLVPGLLIAPDEAALLVPLRGRSDRLLGMIYLRMPEAHPPDPTALQLLAAIARQAGLSLENAQLAARTTRLLAKEQLLTELGRDVGNTLDLAMILERTTERLAGMFAGGTLALLNAQNELEIVATLGEVDAAARAVRLKLGEGMSGWVAQYGLPFLSNDTRNETRVLPAARDIGSNRRIQSYIAVPLRSGGKIIGTLSIESPERNAFTYEDVDLLEAVAAQIGGPIAGARLYQQSERLAEQVKRRNEQLMVLNAVARAAVSTLDVDRMLALVTTQIQQGFGYDHVELYMVDEELGEYLLKAQAGPDAAKPAGYRQSQGSGLLGRAHRTATTQRVDDVWLDSDYLAEDGDQTRAELCVPMVAGGRVLAILNLESRLVAAFTDEDVGVLETAADVLASAIENARLYQRSQEVAVLEERSRLARDLHDSISQQLFSMTLTAQAARTQLDKNPLRAAAQLERLQETSTAALGEMRALIFQLRPPGLSEQGLIMALQQHASALSRREGLTITMQVSGDERYARGAEQAIYRIAQEALNNVLRHAGACEVQVALDLQPEAIRLQVADDGKGFDPDNLPGGHGRHLGLISMRERAAEIGGTLELRSQPGKGTAINLVVPRVDEEVGEGVQG